MKNAADWSPSFRTALIYLTVTTGIIATIARFSYLGDRVLTPDEARNAWPAWVAADAGRNLHADPEAHHSSPLLNNLTWITFWILGPSDTLARIAPALIGSLAVMSPWFFRGWLGNAGALAGALLFMLNPWHVAFSRSSESTIFSAFLALAALAGVDVIGQASRGKQAHESQSKILSPALAAVLALFAASGPDFWSFVLPVIAYGLAVRCFSLPSTGRNGTKVTTVCDRKFGAVFAATLLLCSSALGARWENLTGIGSGLTEWIEKWGTAAVNGYSWTWAFERILNEQPLTLTMGLLGIILLWRERGPEAEVARRRASALSLWTLWGFIITIPGGRGPAGLLVMDIPLVLAAAWLLGRLVELTTMSRDAQVWSRLVLPVTTVLASGWIWFLFHRHGRFPPGYSGWFVCFFAGASALGLLFLFKTRPGKGLVFASMMALCAAEMKGGWALSRRIYSEPIFFHEIGHPDVRLLQQDLRHWIAHSERSEDGIRLGAAGDASSALLVHWYLRDFHMTSVVPGHESPVDGAALITWTAGTSYPPAERLASVPYRVMTRRPSHSEARSSDSVSRQAPVAPNADEVVLLWLPKT